MSNKAELSSLCSSVLSHLSSPHPHAVLLPAIGGSNVFSIHAVRHSLILLLKRHTTQLSTICPPLMAAGSVYRNKYLHHQLQQAIVSSFIAAMIKNPLHRQICNLFYTIRGRTITCKSNLKVRHLFLSAVPGVRSVRERKKKG